MKKQIFSIIVVLMVATLCSAAEITCYGDSIAYGICGTAPGFDNRAVGGQDTKDIVPGEPMTERVFISTGTHDLTSAFHRDGDPEKVILEIARVLDAFSGQDVVIGLLLPVRKMPDKIIQRIKRLNDLIKELVEKRRAAGYAVRTLEFTGIDDIKYQDHVHPTKEGFRELNKQLKLFFDNAKIY